MRDLTRDVPRARRTEAEKEEIRRRMGSVAARFQAEKSGAPRTLPPVSDEKPHFGSMALRFDEDGRLWVRTGRGNERRAVFDVFEASFRYLGEVVVPGRVGVWTAGQGVLVTAGESDGGVPVVLVWRLQQ